MKRRAFRIAGVPLVAALLLAGSAGAALGEPHKNQISVPVSCSNGAEVTFVVNGESNAGQVVGEKRNVLIKRYEATYYSPDGTVVGEQSFDGGTRTGQQGSLVSCAGESTFTHWQLGKVRTVLQFEGFFTPRDDG